MVETLTREKARTKAQQEFENKESILQCLQDIIFKELFGNDEPPHLTAYLISVFVDISYSDIKDKIVFASNRIRLPDKKSKKGEKDIALLVKNVEPRKILMEENRSGSRIDIIITRNFYWATNFFGSGLKKNDNYNKVIPTIQLNFNDFYTGASKQEWLEVYEEKNQVGDILNNGLKTFHIIAKAYQIWYTGDIQKEPKEMYNKILIGALLYTASKQEFQQCLEELEAPEEVKRDIERTVIRMNNDVEVYFDCFDPDTDYLMLQRSIADELGRKEAKQELQQSIIRKLFQKGMDLASISNYLEIPMKDVKKIIEN